MNNNILAMPTKKQIIDSVQILATRFNLTDDSRLDPDYIGFLVEQVRATLILNEYNITGVLNPDWFIDFGLLEMTKVNIADDPIVTSCECDITKVQIPETVHLTKLGEGNLDLGLKVISACGKTSYTIYPLEFWKDVPKDHVRAKFSYYDRFGTQLYTNKLANFLRFIGIPATTQGLIIKKTLPVISGSIKSGTVYMVKGTTGNVTYNSVVYLPNQTFTGVVGVKTFTASSNSQVFYNDYQVEMTENDPYPVSTNMARDIVIEIMVKEFQIEKQQVADVINDSADDVIKIQ